MKLKVLRYFLAVAREGSITAAAQFLNVTQPTLSRQLMELEEQLGQRLFIRSYHNITLTPEGMLLRKRAEEIMELVHKTEDEFNSIGETVSGDIYIGGGETDAMKLITRVIKETQSEYPDIRFHLYSGNIEDVTERIDKGTLDFGILIQPADISRYDYVNLPATDLWGIIMRKDCPLAKKEAVAFEDLMGLPLICSRRFLQKNSHKTEYPKWFRKDFDKLKIVASYNLIYNAALMVKEGIGYAIGLDKLINITYHSDLCFRPLKPKAESGLNIIWKKYQVFSPAAVVFLEKIREKFSEPEG